MSDSDIVQEFLAESYENLDRLDRDLVGLEKNPQDGEALAGVFRTIHTIKGTCGFLGFNKLEKVAHVGENLLTRLRDGQLILNPEITTALLGMVDVVRQMLKEIGSTGQDGEEEYLELRETLTRLQTVARANDVGARPSPPAADVQAVPAAEAAGVALSVESVTPLEARSEAEVVPAAKKKDDSPVVDEISDTEEIVVKPLRKQLKTVKTFAGSSIMGDGKVALILDVLGLAQRASVVTGARDRARSEKTTESAETAAEKQTFLLFAGPGDSRMAIPLSTLARLEEFPVAQVEMSGREWVTQYRGQILPLVRLNVVLEERRNKLRALQALPEIDSGPIQVLVLNHEGRTFGLVVERILDIVEDVANIRSKATRGSVLYSVVIDDRVTELLDIPAIIRSAESIAVQPGFPGQPAKASN